MSETMMRAESFGDALNAFYAGCQAIYNSHITKLRKGTYAEGRTDLPEVKWELDRSEPRYVRIWRNGVIHCFVDKITGDVFKAQNSIRPALHARGNIRDKDGGLRHMKPFGPALYWDMVPSSQSRKPRGDQ
jgi:hypothetical protein